VLISEVYFWQRIVTPHMANLAEALAKSGVAVTYVANESMSCEREQMGWFTPSLVHAALVIAPDTEAVAALALNSPIDSIHVCQGLRSNGLVAIAQRTFEKRGMHQWVIMETVDDAGFSGWLKRALYRWILMHRRNDLQGILAIGWKTSDWLIARGIHQDQIFPFAYFLRDEISLVTRRRERDAPFRFLFVGQLIERKRVDQFILALVRNLAHDFEFLVVGDGPMREEWEQMANHMLPNRVRWLGGMSMNEIPQQMADADCLVLPSRHDGWGAVVSEALMVGTPVICSDACGSAGVVYESGFGSVYAKDDLTALSRSIGTILCKEVQQDSEEYKLKTWSRCLGAEMGALYLNEIFQFAAHKKSRPLAPWYSSPIPPAMMEESF
jgi:glycosyltransferase involved in cell wall biosynthesis